MEKEVYLKELANENHWWFVGRRRLFEAIIRDLKPAENAMILDVGISSGTNLAMLRDNGFSAYLGLDNNATALELCRAKAFPGLCGGSADQLPFDSDCFDFILATDVIEHVDDDSLAMREMHRVLKKGGKLILTVPCYRFLWGLQDEVSHHKRRYTMQEVLALVKESKLEATEQFHFNFILLLPILVARTYLKFFRHGLASENQINSPGINKILTGLFSWDVNIARRLKIPFGVSALVVCSKPE